MAVGAVRNNSSWKQRWRGLHPSIWFIIAATFAVAAANITVSLWHYYHYESHAFDLGIFDQALWRLSHFQIPANTVRGVANLFSDHFHPILILFVPFYWIFNSPTVLLVAQGLMFASIIPLSYTLGKILKLPPWPTAILSFAFGINAGFATALGFDFHEIAFAVPLLILAFIFSERKRWIWFAIVIGLLVLTKESMSVYTAGTGLTLMLRRFFRAGAITVASSLVAYLIITSLIMPRLGDGARFVYWDQYRHLAPSPVELPIETLQHPKSVLGQLIDDPHKVQTTSWLLKPLVFLPLVSWSFWPLTFVTLAERFFSSNPVLWGFGFHYQVLSIVVFAVATLYLLSDSRRWWSGKRLIYPSMAVVALLLTIWVHVQTKPLKVLADTALRQRPIKLWGDELKLIPRDATVSAMDTFVPRLTHRSVIYRFPAVGQAQWLILDSRASAYPLKTSDVAAIQDQLKSDPRWTLVRERETFTVFHRDDTSAIEESAFDVITD